jgi:hypothetical protein
MAKFSRAFPLSLVCVGSLRAGWLAALAFGAVACGPSYDEHTIKTADDRLKEQEELAYQEELRARNKPEATGEVVEETEKPGAFDDKQADLELKRATRSAETCPEVVTGDKVPHGKTTVTLTFALDGSVAEATIAPPFEGTRIGDCALNAYQAIIVPPYTGERKVITWDVNLEKPKAEKASKTKK